MIFRRLARPVTILLATWCLWQIVWQMYLCEFPVLINVTVQKAPATPLSKIAKVTVAANTLNSSIIHQALQTHQVQNDIYGYKQFIATNELVSDLSEHDPQRRPRGAWSKPAYLLSIIVDELAKPESERLEWVYWFDADTIVMNPHTPLEIFVPPSSHPEISNIHLLMASNWDGLNSGAFAFRVHPWSVSILSAILAYPIYYSQKQQTDRFRDQSAFQFLLQSPDSPLASNAMNGRNSWENWAEVPMRWFNSLPINNAFSKKWDWIFNHNMSEPMFDNGTDLVFNDGRGPRVQPWKVMQGDMVVHFAGADPVRASWMGPWLNRAEKHLPEWSNVTKQEELKVEVEQFWKMTAERIAWEKTLQKKQKAKAQARPKAKPTVAAGPMLQPTKISVKRPPVSPSVQDVRKDSANQLKESQHFKNSSGKSP